MASAPTTVQEAVHTLTEHFANSGYSAKYRNHINRVLTRFRTHCVERGVVQLEPEQVCVAMLELYGVEPGAKNGRNAETRVMNALLGLLRLGKVVSRKANEHTVPPQFALSIRLLLDAYRRDRKSEETIERYYFILCKVTKFFDERGVKSPAELTLAHLGGFISTVMIHHGPQHVANELRAMRMYLKLLYEYGEIPEDFSGKLPTIRRATHQVHLPSIFTPMEVERLLSAVDRASPLGKRDYAILLLAAKLGLRSGDIRGLKFEHIDWENNVIRKVQQKTGEPISLPLLPELGWALIDYIRHGRPTTEAQEIFVRQVAPYVPMTYYDNMLSKYLQKAGIRIENVRHGMHTLRHSLATTLLDQQTPLPVIQEVLGHRDPASTQHYISVAVEQLKSCAMEVPNAPEV